MRGEGPPVVCLVDTEGELTSPWPQAWNIFWSTLGDEAWGVAERATKIVSQSAMSIIYEEAAKICLLGLARDGCAQAHRAAGVATDRKRRY